MQHNNFFRMLMEKDWFIYQAGCAFALMILIASLVVANYTQILPIYPEYLKQGAFNYQITRGISLSGLIILGTIIVDSTCVFLQKKGFLESDPID